MGLFVWNKSFFRGGKFTFNHWDNSLHSESFFTRILLWSGDSNFCIVFFSWTVQHFKLVTQDICFEFVIFVEIESWFFKGLLKFFLGWSFFIFSKNFYVLDLLPFFVTSQLKTPNLGNIWKILLWPIFGYLVTLLKFPWSFDHGFVRLK